MCVGITYDLWVSGDFGTENYIWKLGIIQNLGAFSWFSYMHCSSTSKSYTANGLEI